MMAWYDVGWPFSAADRSRFTDSLPSDVKPHPAVARIIVPEGGATAFGSGTLVGVRNDHGLVVTNWHVVRDGLAWWKSCFRTASVRTRGRSRSIRIGTSRHW